MRFSCVQLLWVVSVTICIGRMVGAKRNETDFADHSYQRSMNYRSWKEQNLARKLLDGYKKGVRPRGTNSTLVKDGGPVEVLTTLKLKSISSFNDANMEFTAEFRFIQEWMDNRLTYEHLLTDKKDLSIDWVYLADDQVEKLWIPDTFFQNEKRGHDHRIDRINQFLRVSKIGWIVYNKRFSMTFSCVMMLKRYPHDVQTCFIDFGTYAYTTTDIQYVWSETPIVMEAPSKLRPKFSIESIKNDSCASKTNTGEYSCLRIELELRRVFSFFLLQLYIPSIMLVGVSCVSYWIDWKASPARVPLSIVTLLTMITQSHVSYTKAIDIWIGACIVFIFGSLIEYAVVNYTGVQEERKKQLAQRRSFFFADTPMSNNQPSFIQTIISGATVKQTVYWSVYWR